MALAVTTIVFLLIATVVTSLRIGWDPACEGFTMRDAEISARCYLYALDPESRGFLLRVEGCSGLKLEHYFYLRCTDPYSRWFEYWNNCSAKFRPPQFRVDQDAWFDCQARYRQN